MSTVTLPQDLGIESTSELKQQLASQLGQAGPLSVDASQVSRIHTAAMQVLCAFALARQQAGQVTVFENASGSFRDAARLLGVLQAMGLEATPDTMNSVENAA